MSLFADDTKIWRSMHSEADCSVLQDDITRLNNWCNQNKMKFHPGKCKVVSIISNPQNFFPGQLAFCKKAVVGLAARRIF